MASVSWGLVNHMNGPLAGRVAAAVAAGAAVYFVLTRAFGMEEFQHFKSALRRQAVPSTDEGQ